MDSFNTAKFALLAVIVVAGSAIAGYFLAGGTRQPTPIANFQASQQSTAGNALSPGSAKPEHAGVTEDYTAPGSPRILIREEKAPAAASVEQAPPPANQTDSEAGQEGSASAGASSDNATPAPVTGNATSPAASPQSSDPDYEQTTSADSEASQEGTGAEQGKAQYRVQVGVFDQARNAHILADALRNRGYSTSTISEHVGDKTVYHVQAGAYRTRSAADRATEQLQHEGFPALVSPISQ